MELYFTIDMTWGRLILLSLSKKRPKNPDIKGAGKWWLSQCKKNSKCFYFWWAPYFLILYDPLQGVMVDHFSLSTFNFLRCAMR